MGEDFLHLAAMPIIIKMAVSVGMGMLIGMEREWSNKDAGIRTFAIVSLLGMLAPMIGNHFTIASLAGVLMLIFLTNIRSILTDRTLGITTSVVMILNYTLGVLVGLGHIFAPVAGTIIVMALLACKTELNRFTGGVQPSEIRSAILLGLIAFVIFPLMPDRYVDRWQLFNPHDAWAGIVAICGISFLNYILLRVFRENGLFLSALFGGLVNSTATVAELSSRANESGLIHKLDKLCLTIIIAMCIRNVVIVGIFSPAALAEVLMPVIAMSMVCFLFILNSNADKNKMEMPMSLTLNSPIAIRKVLVFAALFLAIQIGGAILTRLFGQYGIFAAGIIGGFVSSASSTAAAASMASHNLITTHVAATVAVVSSLSSTIVNIPIVLKIVNDKPVRLRIFFQSLTIILIGSVVLVLNHFFHLTLNLPVK